MEMKRYQKDNNSYLIFNVDVEHHQVHFLWGKFDFRLALQMTSNQEDIDKAHWVFKNSDGQTLLIDRLEHRINGKWYEYIKICDHGFTFEETHWKHQEQDHYAEFPRDLLKIAAEITAEELGLSTQ